jgi:hypothetical protein
MICTQSGGMEKAYMHQYIHHVGENLRKTPIVQQHPDTEFILCIDCPKVHVSLKAIEEAHK